MTIKANESKNSPSGASAPLIEAGTYPARLVVVADLGLQTQRPFQGQEKPPAFEILTTYELVDEFMQDDEGNDLPDKPRWVSESFALYSLASERAKSTLRYNGLDPTHAYEGDWEALLAKPCMVTLIHNPGKGKNLGKTYLNIANVAPMREKDSEKLSGLVNEALSFDLDAPDVGVFEKLPSWVQDRVKAGLEYAGSALHEALKVANPPKDVESHAKSAPLIKEDAELDDEVPF